MAWWLGDFVAWWLGWEREWADPKNPKADRHDHSELRIQGIQAIQAVQNILAYIWIVEKYVSRYRIIRMYSTYLCNDSGICRAEHAKFYTYDHLCSGFDTRILCSDRASDFIQSREKK